MNVENIFKLGIKEQLNLAYESKNLEILKKLLGSPIMIVRRALSKNKYIDKYIANTLAYDPVLNVSYMANKNPVCTVNRTFEEKYLTKCVTCTHDEREIDCKTCEYKRKFR